MSKYQHHTLPNIETLRNQLVEDLKVFDENVRDDILLLYLNSAFRLGKEVRDRELAGNDGTSNRGVGAGSAYGRRPINTDSDEWKPL